MDSYTLKIAGVIVFVAVIIIANLIQYRKTGKVSSGQAEAAAGKLRKEQQHFLYQRIQIQNHHK